MRYRLDRQRNTENETARPWLSAILAWQQGLGLIVFFWLFVVSFLGALILLIAGIAHWNNWMFFGGLLSLRFFIYLIEIGGELWDVLDPPER